MDTNSEKIFEILAFFPQLRDTKSRNAAEWAIMHHPVGSIPPRNRRSYRGCGVGMMVLIALRPAEREIEWRLASEASADGRALRSVRSVE
jgi:hypothetical protein